MGLRTTLMPDAWSGPRYLHFRERYGGVPRVKLSFFRRKAFELHRDCPGDPAWWGLTSRALR